MFRFENKTLLYIDADVETRKSNTALMHRNGLKVLETDNTASALDLFKNNKVDFIVIDLDLHVQNRIEFIRFLRDNEVMIPIIITADDANQDVLLEVINLDTSHYLIKPFDSSELLDSLKHAAKKICETIEYTSVDLDRGFSYDCTNKLINNPNGIKVPLTRKEYLLFELLLNNKKNFLSYEFIDNNVWQDEVMSIDALRTLILSLRKKTYTELIINHSSLGYKIEF